MSRPYPYNPDELRGIADQIDKILEHVDPSDITNEGDWRWGLSIEIYNPNDPEEVVGRLKSHPDGWLGFYPSMEVT